MIRIRLEFSLKKYRRDVMLTFLEVNGIRLDCSNDDVVEAGLGVASGKWVMKSFLPGSRHIVAFLL